MSGIPTKPPKFTTRDWGAAVRQSWADDWHKREVSYIFDPDGKKRTFEDSGGASGIYGIPAEPVGDAPNLDFSEGLNSQYLTVGLV